MMNPSSPENIKGSAKEANRMINKGVNYDYAFFYNLIMMLQEKFITMYSLWVLPLNFVTMIQLAVPHSDCQV